MLFENGKYSVNKKSLIIKYLLALGWLVVIFSLSNEPAALSSARSDTILHTVQSINISFFHNATEFIIRKSAHLSAYFILGMLLFSLVSEYRFSTKRMIIFSIFLSAAYACTDEIHQLFVLGRTGQPRDVLIDTIGATIGIFVCFMLYARIKRLSQTSNV